MTTTLSDTTAREGVERATVPPFAVITGAQVQRVLQGREKEIVELVAATYRLHGAGDSVNPPSYFLRFPGPPVCSDHCAAGVDWWVDPGRRIEVGL